MEHEKNIHEVMGPLRDRVSKVETRTEILSEENMSIRKDIAVLDSKVDAMGKELRSEMSDMESRLSGHINSSHQTIMNTLKDHIDDDKERQSHLQATLEKIKDCVNNNHEASVKIKNTLNIGWAVFLGAVIVIGWFIHETGILAIIFQ